MKKKLKAAILIALAVFQTGVYADADAPLVSERVISVTPSNEEIGIDAQNCEMVVTYAGNVEAADKTVLVNGSDAYTESVASESDKLAIKFKDLKEGTRYKVSVDGTDGNDITTFFTTGFSDLRYSAKYEKGSYTDFYGKHGIGTATVTNNKFTFSTTNEKRKKGCYVMSQVLNISADENPKMVIGLSSEKAVTLNVAFNKTGDDKGFNDSFVIQLSGGEEEITIDTKENENWTETITQMMLEQAEPIINTINISHIYLLSDTMIGTYTGTLDIYENFGTPDENIVTGKALNGGKVTVSLGAMKSVDEKGAFLVAVYFNNGKMENGVCKYIDLSDGKTSEPATVELDTQPGGYVKAFLRRGIKNITALAPSVSTAQN